MIIFEQHSSIQPLICIIQDCQEASVDRGWRWSRKQEYSADALIGSLSRRGFGEGDGARREGIWFR